MAKKTICPNCGKINQKGDKFCGDCGSALKESSGTDKSKEIGGYLVCKSCGGSYKLQEGESPDDFESCQCGGKLTHTADPAKLSSESKSKLTSEESGKEKAAKSVKTLQEGAKGGFKKLSNKRKATIGFTGICIIGLILIFALGVIPTSSGKVFENQFVKFQVPEGVNVTDRSTDNSVFIEFNKGGKSVGSIQYKSMDNSPFTVNDAGFKKITVAGKGAVESSNDQVTRLLINITDGIQTSPYSGSLFGFDFYFYDNNTYNIIKNSFVIKKTPS